MNPHYTIQQLLSGRESTAAFHPDAFAAMLAPHVYDLKRRYLPRLRPLISYGEDRLWWLRMAVRLSMLAKPTPKEWDGWGLAAVNASPETSSQLLSAIYLHEKPPEMLTHLLYGGLIDNRRYADSDAESFADEWLNREDAQLALAFTEDLAKQADEIKTAPLLGAFILSPVADLHPEPMNHIRVWSTGSGLWLSLVLMDGRRQLFYWSPNHMEMVAMLYAPLVYSPIVSLFCACLWLDMKKRQVVKVPIEAIAADSGSWMRRTAEKRILLPRRIYKLEWGASPLAPTRPAHMPEEAAERTPRKPPRAHYRQLPEGWEASGEALGRAQRAGVPRPPAGWTFVSARQGEQSADETDTRLIPVGGYQVFRLFKKQL